MAGIPVEPREADIPEYNIVDSGGAATITINLPKLLNGSTLDCQLTDSSAVVLADKSGTYALLVIPLLERLSVATSRSAIAISKCKFSKKRKELTVVLTFSPSVKEAGATLSNVERKRNRGAASVPKTELPDETPSLIEEMMHAALSPGGGDGKEVATGSGSRASTDPSSAAAPASSPSPSPSQPTPPFTWVMPAYASVVGPRAGRAVGAHAKLLEASRRHHGDGTRGRERFSDAVVAWASAKTLPPDSRGESATIEAAANLGRACIVGASPTVAQEAAGTRDEKGSAVEGSLALANIISTSFVKVRAWIF